ncbi:MAG: transketolase family protein [Promethearchaeota archaeon]
MEKGDRLAGTLNTLIANLQKHNAPIAPRDAFGLALDTLGATDKRIVVIDADLSNSTRTSIFALNHPSRFFNVGIKEQDMISIGAGMATCGKIPIIVTYATFLVGRGLDQIRNMVAHCNLNVKLVGTHVGLATGEDGATHQALEDIGIMRGIPRMWVMSPSDAIETIRVLQYALKTQQPVYIRISRAKEEILHDQHYTYDPNNVEIIETFQEKKIAILATGAMVSRSIKAAEILKKRDIRVGVINIHTIKPIDKKTLTRVANEVELMVTVEDHNVIGGLGTAVADTMIETKSNAILRKIGVNDTFGESGSQKDLYVKHGLTPELIAKKIIKEKEEM